MDVVAPIILSFAIFLSVFSFSFWMIFAQLIAPNLSFVAWLLDFVSGISVAVWFWRSLEGNIAGLISHAFTGALITGAIGFVGDLSDQ